MNLSLTNLIISLSFYIVWMVLLVLANKKDNLKGLKLAFLIVLTLAVFRYGSGTDYFGYQSIFENNRTLNIADILSGKGDYEIFFHLLLFTLYFFKLDFYFFIGIHAVILIFTVYQWIKMSSRFPVQSFFVYFSIFFLVWNLSALRQVIPLVFASFLFYNERFSLEWKYKFLLSILLAFFHYSALFYTVILLLELIEWNKSRLFKFFIGSLIVSLLPVKQIVLTICNIPLIVNTPIIQKIIIYTSTMPVEFGFFDRSSFLRLFFIIVILFHYDQLIKISPYIKKLVNTTVFGLSFFFILRFNSLTAQRLTIYVLVLLVMLLPEILHLYDKYDKRVRQGVLAIFIAVNAFIYFKDLYVMKEQMGIKDNNWFIEYHHIFEKRD